MEIESEILIDSNHFTAWYYNDMRSIKWNNEKIIVFMQSVVNVMTFKGEQLLEIGWIVITVHCPFIAKSFRTIDVFEKKPKCSTRCNVSHDIQQNWGELMNYVALC